MTIYGKFLRGCLGVVAIAACGLIDDGGVFSFTAPAQARIGHPLTPGSVAGTIRRVTRRTVRRSTIYANSLPGSCVQVIINGIMTWQCGPNYYQAYGPRYVIVYVK
jgi:hypothetical protein